MAELCLDCMNKYAMGNGKRLTEKDVTMSDDWCEGCCEWKLCVITIKKKHGWGRLKQKAEGHLRGFAIEKQ